MNTHEHFGKTSTAYAAAESDEQDHTVYVGNLVETISNDELMSAFTKIFGPATLLNRCSPVASMTQSTTKCQYCFIRLETKAQHARALALAEGTGPSPLVVHNRQLYVRRRQSKGVRDQRYSSSPHKNSASSSPEKKVDHQKVNDRVDRISLHGSSSNTSSRMQELPRDTIDIPTWHTLCKVYC